MTDSPLPPPPSMRPTLPGTRSAVHGRVVALEARIVTLEVRVGELLRWNVAICCALATFVLLALLYAARRYFS